MTDPFDTYFPNFDADEWEPRVGRGGYRYEVNRRTGAKRPAAKIPGTAPALGKVEAPDTSAGAILKEGAKLTAVSIAEGVASLPEQVEGISKLPGMAVEEVKRRARPRDSGARMEILLEAEREKQRRKLAPLAPAGPSSPAATLAAQVASPSPDLPGISLAPRSDTLLGERREAVRSAYEAQIGRFAEATSDLPTPAAAGLYAVAEGLALAGDPTNLVPGGAVLDAARGGRAGGDLAQAGKALPGPVARPVASTSPGMPVLRRPRWAASAEDGIARLGDFASRNQGRVLAVEDLPFELDRLPLIRWEREPGKVNPRRGAHYWLVGNDTTYHAFGRGGKGFDPGGGVPRLAELRPQNPLIVTSPDFMEMAGDAEGDFFRAAFEQHDAVVFVGKSGDIEVVTPPGGTALVPRGIADFDARRMMAAGEPPEPIRALGPSLETETERLLGVYERIHAAPHADARIRREYGYRGDRPARSPAERDQYDAWIAAEAGLPLGDVKAWRSFIEEAAQGPRPPGLVGALGLTRYPEPANPLRRGAAFVGEALRRRPRLELRPGAADIEPVWAGYGGDHDGRQFAAWLEGRGIDPVDAERTGDIHRLRDEFFEEANPDPDVLPSPTEILGPEAKAPIEVNLLGKKFTIDDPESGAVRLGPPGPPTDPATAAFRAQVFDDGPATPPLRERLVAIKDRLEREIFEAEAPYIKAMDRVGDRRTAEFLMKELRGVGHTAMLPILKETRRWNPSIRDFETTGPPMTAFTDQLSPADYQKAEAIAVAQSQVEFAETVAARNAPIIEQRAARAAELRDYRRARAQARRKVSQVAEANAVELPGLKSREPLPRLGQFDEEMTARSRAYLDEMAASGDLERLAPQLEAYRDWSARAQVEPLVGAGFLSREAADRILASKERYAIFQVVEDELGSRGIRLGKEGEDTLPRYLRSAPRAGVISQRQSPLRQRKEGLVEGRRILPTFEAAAVQAAKIERLAVRQVIRNELVERVKLHPQALSEVRPAVKKMHGKDVPDPDAPGSFMYWQNGERVPYQAPDELLDVIDRLRPEEAHVLLDAAAAMARTVRAGSTSNVDFPLVNVLRDQPSFGVFTRHGGIPYYDPTRVLVQRTLHNLGLPALADPVLMRHWDEFTASAAGQTTFHGADRGGINKSLRRSRNRLTPEGRWRERARYLNPIHTLREYSQFKETASRVAEHDLAKRGGRKTVVGLPIPGTKGKGHAPLGKSEAMVDAGDVGLDFLRGGRVMRAANRYIPFFNVPFLDARRFYTEMRDRPLTLAARGIAYVTLPSLAVEWVRRDDPDYQNLPGWDRGLFWHVNKIDSGPLKGHYVRVLKPLGALNLVFGVMPQLALREHLHGEEAATAREAAAGMLENSPLSLFLQQRDDGGLTGSTDAIPAAFKGPIEVAVNQNWQGREIFDESLPAELQRGERTSGAVAAVAGGIDRMVPETAQPFVPEALRSPDQLQHLIHSYTGGLGRTALELPGLVMGTRDASDVRNVPFARRFLSPPPFGFSSQPYREAQSAIEKAEGAHRARQRALDAGDDALAEAIAARYPEALLFTIDGPAWDLATERRDWGELRDAREWTEKTPTLTEEERKAKLLEIDMDLTQAAAEVLRIIREERAKRGAPAPQAPPAAKPDPFDQYFPNFE